MQRLRAMLQRQPEALPGEPEAQQLPPPPLADADVMQQYERVAAVAWPPLAGTDSELSDSETM